MQVKKWLHEPLVHFLLAGTVLFIFFAWQGEPVDPASRSINISQEDRARLALQWEATMQRPPTDAELDSMTETWLREEILYREGLRLGLDRDDAVVRKRLASKMDFLAASMAETAQPSEEVLSDWLKNNAALFADDSTYSFDQIYFSSKPAALAARPAVSSGADWKEMGEPISLPRQGEGMTAKAVGDRFGGVFLENLQAIRQTGEWSAPVPSGFGWHLVRLREVKTGEVPKLADIRARVENDWRSRTAEKRRDEAYQTLRDSYDITIEK